MPLLPAGDGPEITLTKDASSRLRDNSRPVSYDQVLAMERIFYDGDVAIVVRCDHPHEDKTVQFFLEDPLLDAAFHAGEAHHLGPRTEGEVIGLMGHPVVGVTREQLRRHEEAWSLYHSPRYACVRAVMSLTPRQQAVLFQRWPVPEREIVEGAVFRNMLYDPEGFPTYAVRVMDQDMFPTQPAQQLRTESPEGEKEYLVHAYGDDEQSLLLVPRSFLLDFQDSPDDQSFHPEGLPHLDEMKRDWTAYIEKMRGSAGEGAEAAEGSEEQANAEPTAAI